MTLKNAPPLTLGSQSCTDKQTPVKRSASTKDDFVLAFCVTIASLLFGSGVIDYSLDQAKFSDVFDDTVYVLYDFLKDKDFLKPDTLISFTKPRE